MNQFNHLPNNPDPELIKKLLSDRKVMVAVTRESIFYFFYIYFGSYIKYPVAPFHLEMFNLAQNDSIKRIGVVAFRDSAKSTILNTAYALWAIMGIHQKKHIVIASQTQHQAREHLKNIRKEIEKNDLLRQYLGPFEETEDRWNAAMLIIPRYGARISAISVEEGIRGLREGPHRPDLILVDDIEDSASIKTKEGRDKTFNWLTGELLPLGNLNTKVIFIGNFLHEDSVLMRIEKLIKEGKMRGTFFKVPLLNDNNEIAWPGKFPSLDKVEEYKQGFGSEIAWQREFLLRTVPDSDQLIYPEWLHYYRDLPDKRSLLHVATGVDLAISQKDTADYTAMVSAKIYRIDERVQIYILPNPINERLTFPQTLERLKLHSQTIGNGYRTHLYIEKVGYQEALVQQLEKEGFSAEGVALNGQDKRARLSLTTALLQNGQIHFPEKGAEDLIRQLVGFGVERYDDLADAFTLLVLQSLKHNNAGPRILWL